MKKEIVKEKNNYVEARGARKTAIARVRLIDSLRGITVNGKEYQDYFKLPRARQAIDAPLALVGGFAALGQKGVSVWVRGGGIMGQAEAVRHGLTRVLAGLNSAWRTILKTRGFLTRDARTVERKKYGLKKARKAPQWAKR